MVLSGGPASGSVHPVSGAVVAVAASGKTKTAVVGATGTFDLTLPVGVYTVAGTDSAGQDNCADRRRVVVKASAVTTVLVVCPAR
jgi:hypothetical protein